MPRNILDEAGRLVAAGLSVIPICADGSKRPAVEWKTFQARRPCEDELRRWFRGRHTGLAVLGGAVSGHLEILDFDAPAMFLPWARMMKELCPGLLEWLPWGQTPTDGRHCWGTKGAGKTSLLQLFWRLFGVESELLSCTETEFALLSLLSSTTSIPLVFDEFKPWDMRQDQVRRFERILRRVYQGEVEHRGKPDLRLVAYRLTAPVAVAGEMPVTTQPALMERVVPVSPSPHWLAEHPDAHVAYAALIQLSLSNFSPLYIQWTLQRNFAQDFTKAQQVFNEALKGRPLPDRVRHNAMVVVFGLCQFEAFGQAYALEVPEQLDYKAILDPMLEQLCNAEGMTRTAVDDLLEHLSTLAEMGRLNRQQHYTWTPDEAIALRPDLCLAEFRKYARETLLDGEVLNRAAYLRQLRENQRAKGYVKGTSELAYFGQERKRAVLIDPAQAEQTGLDLGGFVR